MGREIGEVETGAAQFNSGEGRGLKDATALLCQPDRNVSLNGLLMNQLKSDFLVDCETRSTE
jgi:hypothetical protein